MLYLGRLLRARVPGRVLQVQGDPQGRALYSGDARKRRAAEAPAGTVNISGACVPSSEAAPQKGLEAPGDHLPQQIEGLDEPVDKLGALPGDCEACLQTLAAQPLMHALSERDALFEASARAAQANRRPPVVVAEAVCSKQIAAVQERLGALGAIHGECQASWNGRFAEHVMIQPSLYRTICASMPRLGSNGFLRTCGMASWSLSGYCGAITPACSPDAPNDRPGKTPARLEALRKLMRGFLSTAEVDAAIHSPVPPRFKVPNHTPVLEHAGFVEAELIGYLGTGAISFAREEDMQCMLALGVVDHGSG